MTLPLFEFLTPLPGPKGPWRKGGTFVSTPKKECFTFTAVKARAERTVAWLRHVCAVSRSQIAVTPAASAVARLFVH